MSAEQAGENYRIVMLSVTGGIQQGHKLVAPHLFP